MISKILASYHNQTINDEHHRYKSWEHCHQFFSKNYNRLDDEQISDHACLHLAFYLASWGMLRGGAFLLQKDYQIHRFFLKEVVKNPANWSYFANRDLQLDYKNIEGIDNLITKTNRAYEGNIEVINGEKEEITVTDTLSSKILLGVFGNVPAYDRYFKEGLKVFGIRSQFDERSLIELVDFYHHNNERFESNRKKFEVDGAQYTPMKLIDMFFWKIGYMLDNPVKYVAEMKEIAGLSEEYKSKRKNKRNDFAKNKTSTSNIQRPGLTEEIRQYIISVLNTAREKGYEFLDLKSGYIHKEMGLKDRLPSVCTAMESLGVYTYEILKDTPSGKSSTKLIRYYLG